jgi:hypothetical protein
VLWEHLFPLKQQRVIEAHVNSGLPPVISRQVTLSLSASNCNTSSSGSSTTYVQCSSKIDTVYHSNKINRYMIDTVYHSNKIKRYMNLVYTSRNILTETPSRAASHCPSTTQCAAEASLGPQAHHETDTAADSTQHG